MVPGCERKTASVPSEYLSYSLQDSQNYTDETTVFHSSLSNDADNLNGYHVKVKGP